LTGIDWERLPGRIVRMLPTLEEADAKIQFSSGGNRPKRDYLAILKVATTNRSLPTRISHSSIKEPL